MRHSYHPFGEHAILVELTGEQKLSSVIRRYCALLEQQAPSWFLECVPAYATIAVFYQPFAFAEQEHSPYEAIKAELEALFSHIDSALEAPPRTIEIPVCYGGSFGPDLAFVARHNRLTEKQVIAYHTKALYTVAMIGFSPGFPFLEGMAGEIAAPRRTTPRLTIPERSVGIAGGQTGVYPIATPGGWQLIGRTPKRLFMPDEEEAILLRAGDRIRFTEISLEAYKELEVRHADHS